MKYVENGIKVSSEDLPNKDFPLEIFCRMVYNATLQGNKEKNAIKALKTDIKSSRIYGGFNWSESKEGFTFWNNIVELNNFELYYKKYPVCKGTYIIEDEYKIPGFTAEVPLDIKQAIIKIVARLGKLDQLYENSGLSLFTWHDTPQGFDYWQSIYTNYFCNLKTIPKIYKTHSELSGHVLKYGDQVNFNGEIYVVEKTYLLNTNLEKNNDAVFKELGINKREFCSKLYGYDLTEGITPSYSLVTGIWIPFKLGDYEAATRVCLELFKIIEGKKTKVSFSVDKQTTDKVKNSSTKFSENEFKFTNVKKKKIRF